MTDRVPFPIAVVGAGIRFPGGANSLSRFWDLIRDGRQIRRTSPPERWDFNAFYDPDPSRRGKGYVRSGGFLDEDIRGFDAAFFGILPQEARVLDPQIRLVLETVWEAFEQAQIPIQRWRGGGTGVYISSFIPDYFLLQGQNSNRLHTDIYHATGAGLSMVANRVSYTFDFRGPSFAIDTACSGSHSAIYLACREIWSGSTRFAVAGGVSLMAYPNAFAALCKGRFLSPDGLSKAFDASADGYGRGEGAGVFLLAPLDIAREAGMTILGMIVGGGANQDGRTDGITVPSLAAQTDLVLQTWREAGLPLDRVGYIEAHGTGTAVGDPIEARALGETFGAACARAVRIGSVKANIGHLEAAAGAASVAKALVMLRHRTLPPLAGLQNPNPAIPFEEFRLQPAVDCIAWESDVPRTIAINGFGYGGSNCHLILQEAETKGPRVRRVPVLPLEANDEQTGMLPLSARSEPALQQLAKDYRELLRVQPLDEICRAVVEGRSVHPIRAMVLGPKHVACEALESLAAGQHHSALIKARRPVHQEPKVLFVFSGIGPQWPGMARQLLSKRSFRDPLEQADEVFRHHAGWSVAQMLEEGSDSSRFDTVSGRQAANWAVQVALVSMLSNWGIKPDCVIGHSLGEIAAAWATGALSLEDSARVCIVRGRCQERTASDEFGMLAAGIGPQRAEELIGQFEQAIRPEVAAINGPASVTLSGRLSELERLAEELEAEGHFVRLMPTKVAYHSRWMDPLEEEFLTTLGSIDAKIAPVEIVSSVTGGTIDGTALGTDYWWRNIRQPVRFGEALGGSLDESSTVVVHLGAHPVLRPSVEQVAHASNVRTLVQVPTLVRDSDDLSALDRCFAEAWAAGIDVVWEDRFDGVEKVDLELPLYPWNREEYWFSTPALREWLHPELKQPMLGVPDGIAPNRWRVELGFVRHPWLPDHQVDGVAVFPAAGFVEAGLAAAAQVAPGAVTICIENMQFREALLIGSETYPELLTELQDLRLAFSSKNWDREGNPHLRLHAEARLLPANAFSRQSDAFKGERSSTFTESVEEFYAVLEEYNFSYGEAFRRLEEFGFASRRGWARMAALPEHLQGDGKWICHPTATDAALQLALRVAAREGLRLGRWLPVGIDRIIFRSLPSQRLAVFAELEEIGDSYCRGDAIIYDEENQQELLRLDGIVLRRIATHDNTQNDHGNLYDEVWRELPPLGHRNALPGDAAWLVSSSDKRSSLLQQLEKQLETAGVSLVEEPGSNVRFVVFDTTSISGSFSFLDDAVEPGDKVLAAGWRIIEFVQQTLRIATVDRPLRILFLTRGGVRVHESDSPPDLLTAALWGIFRSIMVARADLDVLAIDLQPESEADPEAEEIARILFSDPLVKELAWRGGTFLLREIARFLPGTPAPREGTAEAVPLPEHLSSCLEIEEPGRLHTLRFRLRDRRPPIGDEVEIRVAATALNFKDVWKASSLAPAELLSMSASGSHLGLECAGTVVRVGPESTLAEGSRVVCWGVSPGFQTFVTVSSRRCIMLPPDIPFSVGGAQIPLVTAWRALVRLARATTGEVVLVHSAAGGVGFYALEIARMMKLRCIATAGSDQRRASVTSLGVELVCDSRRLDFVDQVMEFTGGRGVDIVLNSLVGEALRQSFRLLAPGGRFIEIGKRDIIDDQWLPMAGFHSNTSFHAIDLDQNDRRLIHEISEDLDAAWTSIRQGEIRLVPTELLPPSHVDTAFQMMLGSRHLGRLAIDFGNAVPVSYPSKGLAANFTPDAAWLVTGGWGEIGFLFVKWLIRQGVTRIGISSRSGPDAERQAEAKLLEEEGVTIVSLMGDVAEFDDCQQWFETLSTDGFHVRGVIHAAGVLLDRELESLSLDAFEVPLRAKVAGSWNLHRLAGSRTEMICLSSIASSWGSAGQTNYACGNAFMDAVIENRLACGLPGASFHLGPVAGARSMAERFHEEAVRYFEAIGFPLLSGDEVVRTMAQLLESGRRRATIVSVDWPVWIKVYRHPGERLRFGALIEEAQARMDQQLTSSALILRLARLDEKARSEAVLDVLVDIVSTETRLSKDALDPSIGLREIGVDSLSSVALDLRIRDAFGVTIPFLILLQEPSLRSMATRIAQEIGSGAPAGS